MAKTSTIQIRLNKEVKDEIIKKSRELNFSSVSEFIIFVSLNAEVKVTANKSS